MTVVVQMSSKFRIFFKQFASIHVIHCLVFILSNNLTQRNIKVKLV